MKKFSILALMVLSFLFAPIAKADIYFNNYAEVGSGIKVQYVRNIMYSENMDGSAVTEDLYKTAYDIHLALRDSDFIVSFDKYFYYQTNLSLWPKRGLVYMENLSPFNLYTISLKYDITDERFDILPLAQMTRDERKTPKNKYIGGVEIIYNISDNFNMNSTMLVYSISKRDLSYAFGSSYRIINAEGIDVYMTGAIEYHKEHRANNYSSYSTGIILRLK